MKLKLSAFLTFIAFLFCFIKRNTYDLSLSFYGKPCKNLVKKSTLTATLPVALTLVTAYSYELESNGNVKSKTMTISGSSTKIVPTYECK